MIWRNIRISVRGHNALFCGRWREEKYSGSLETVPAFLPLQNDWLSAGNKNWRKAGIREENDMNKKIAAKAISGFVIAGMLLAAQAAEKRAIQKRMRTKKGRTLCPGGRHCKRELRGGA